MKIDYKKKFGQNFLSDTNLLSAIVRDSEVDKSDVVVEVGPGAGALTKELAKSAKCVYAFEIDRDLQPVLTENLADFDNVQIVFSDFLKMPNDELKKTAGTGFAVVANLPYYITSPLITKFLTCGLDVQSFTIMVQKEVAERIVATPKSKDYGVLSVMVQLCGQPKIARIVGRQMFTPSPKVDSAIVHMDNIKVPKNYQKIVEFVKTCFASRRKTLVNNLAKQCPKSTSAQMLTKLNISAEARAEDLSPQEFAKLFALFCKNT